MEWSQALDEVRKFTFKIITPQGSGTGFLITLREQGVCGVATAYHVIEHAFSWEEPIKLLHTFTNRTILLRVPDRYILPNPTNDAAIVMFMKGDLDVDGNLLTLAPEDKYLRPGNEIAWAGYPAIAPDEFSFFNGHVSCYLNSANAYLVDGVAINGVSGGPTFTMIDSQVYVIGIVSAYIPNRITGESLPGVCFVTAVKPFHEFMKDIASLEQAKTKAEIAEPSTASDMVPATAPRVPRA
ncbi:MAG: serine protease [Thermodesulfobacteriota bacterium]|nr:serine protease [Thermodesulfobacteriota bacterium]